MKFRLHFGFWDRPATEYGPSPFYRTSTWVVEAQDEAAAKAVAKTMEAGRVHCYKIEQAPDDTPVGLVGRLCNQAGHYSGV